MIALYKVNYWDDDEAKPQENKGFIFAKNENEFFEKIYNYYGKNLDSIAFHFFEDCEEDIIEEDVIINLLEQN